MDFRGPTIDQAELEELLPLPGQVDLAASNEKDYDAIELESLCADFIEQSIGFRDWRTNWHTWRDARGNQAIEDVRDWMKTFKIEGDPEKVVKLLDQKAGRDPSGLPWQGMWSGGWMPPE